MHSPITPLAIVFVIAIDVASAAAQSSTLNHCDGFRVGLNAAWSAHGDRNGGRSTYPDNPRDAAADVAWYVQSPVSLDMDVRAEIGRAAWVFQARDPWGVPLVRDRVRMTRATLSLLKVEGDCSWPMRVYAGGGLGFYRFDFARESYRVTRLGVHGVAGLELRVTDHTAMTAEIGMDVSRGPDRVPVFSYSLFVLRAGAGIRFSF